mmetsp:Transcript_34788/g.82508  ORF Transcript_34788/g.82508 Transcript_34788/m.82508 type:complete len:103 (-) Transcript_34788:1162-1470(-)
MLVTAEEPLEEGGDPHLGQVIHNVADLLVSAGCHEYLTPAGRISHQHKQRQKGQRWIEREVIEANRLRHLKAIIAAPSIARGIRESKPMMRSQSRRTWSSWR